ncbi:phenylalanine--tRNA ligase subunit beta [Candidatus Parcubacteria bacterium]|nr:phenylalanine--tRNA ligase subunit beta [Candidatus Parcubacteria bacterium]
MYLSLDWLRDYVDFPKSLNPEDLGDKLTMHTVEIDSVEKQAEKFERIVLGKILAVKQHPNAERLQIAKVDIGSEKMDIVCGAPNIKQGQLVPVALLGAVLPNGMEIKQTKIRGEESNGMLCAEDEIGLGDGHSGIMILENGKIGQNFADYLKLKDVLFEVDNKSITNRPDLWGHFGMAREVNTFLDLKPNKSFTRINSLNVKNITPEKEVIKIEAKIENYDLCPRYMALAISNIKIEQSPEWIKKRLIAVGIRPINNIIDVGNYVMLDLGQPMHAFDFDFIASKKNEEGGEVRIVVRNAKPDEEMLTLDNENRKLNKETLLITDGKKPIAIAGVMGGENSGINNDTETIILESANFNDASIRKTSAFFGLRSESSQRFEKSLDPNLCEIALAKAVELIKKLCPEAKIASKVEDNKKFSLNQGPVIFELDWLEKFIGHDIKEERIIKILSKLGFGVEIKKEKDTKKSVVSVDIPTWRATKDISIKEDIAEEVARIYGYDNLNFEMPKVKIGVPKINKARVLEKRIRDILSAQSAATEVYNYSFVGEEQLKKMGIDYSNYIRLANPISQNHTMLRQGLSTNMIGSIMVNQARQKEIRLFEIGGIYINSDGNLDKDDKGEEKLPFQEKRVCLAVAEDKYADAHNNAKAIIGSLLETLDFKFNFLSVETASNWADQKTSAQIEIDKEIIGSINRVSKNVKNKVGLKKEAIICELSLNKLLDLIDKKGDLKYQEIAKYPRLIRDLAFVVNEKVLYNDIRDEIKNFHEYVKEVDLFDVYQGEKIGIGNKNLAFHVVYQAGKTLTSEEVDVIQKKLIKRLEERFEAKIRDY